MKIEHFELKNGIRCVFQRTSSNVATMGLTIGVGTRDELEAEHGVAHFVEHMLFKGTKKRKPYHINSYLDNVGGELNAYTTKEETVVHATVLKSDILRGVDLIKDVVFNSIYPENEIDKERVVIIDEINSYKDSPSELIYDDFEDMIFKGSTLGRSILGTKRSLRKINRDTILNFTKRNYVTSEMVFSMVANITFIRFKQICEKYFEDCEPSLRSCERSKMLNYEVQNIIASKGTYQKHCIIGGISYDNFNIKRVPLAVLINLLGGANANSRLNSVVREKYGLSYNIEAGTTAYSDCGVSSIYFGTEKENLDRCIELVNLELKKLRDVEMSSIQLSKIKKQFIGQLLISSDSGENMMLSAGKSMLLYGKVDSLDTLKKKVEAVNTKDIIEVANEVFCESNLSMLIYK
ncbi:MAG: pitrilysin family protein [Rikenellaceae bacterium]